MTETKTLAQNRLRKLQESLKESRKHPKSNSTNQSLRGCQQLSGGINKMGNRKSSKFTSRPSISPSKDSRKLQTGTSLRHLMSYESILNDTTIVDKSEPLQQLNTSCRSDITPLRVTSCNKHKYPNSGISLSAGREPIKIQHCREVAPSTVSGKKIKQTICDERWPKVLQQSPKKRKSYSENLEKTKVIKADKIEYSSKSPVQQNINKNYEYKEKSTTSFQAKFSAVLDSHNAFDGSSPPKDSIKKKLSVSPTSKHHYFKVPINNNSSNNKMMKTSSLPVKNLNSILPDQQVKFKDTKDIKEPLEPPTGKSKLQARLHRVLNDTKKRLKKSFAGFVGISSTSGGTQSTQSDNGQFIESMDWESSNDKILRTIRNEVDPRKELMEWQDIHEVQMESCRSSLYVVVDTNVLLRNLKLLERLSKATIKGFEVALMIPWQVLKELDNLKTKVNYENVNLSARKAIHFLSMVTNHNESKVTFQTQAMHFEDCSQFVVEIPDDHLIKCCFQLKNKNHKVILLSNDISLRIKTSTTNIPAVDAEWMLTILEQEFISTRKKIHCFIGAPKDTDKNHTSDYIHKITQVFLTFLSNVVTEKYREKYGDLYPLWAPTGSCPDEMLNFITSCRYFETFWAELNLIHSFYKKYKSYDSIKPEDVEWIGRKCITLIKSMISFIPPGMALQFFKDLSFLKNPEGLASIDISYIDGSYRLAEKYFKDTESSLNEFVTYINNLYSEQGSLLRGNKDVLHHIDVNLELISHFRNAILKFQEIQGEISLDSEVAKSLHKALCKFLRKKKVEPTFPIFSPEDVVEYVNQNRTFFAPAVVWLSNQESTLKAIQSVMI